MINGRPRRGYRPHRLLDDGGQVGQLLRLGVLVDCGRIVKRLEVAVELGLQLVQDLAVVGVQDEEQQQRDCDRGRVRSCARRQRDRSRARKAPDRR